MRKNTLYRHVANTTVAFEIHTRFWVPETQVWKLKVGWWRIRSYGPPYPMAIGQRITIAADQVRDWVPMAFDARGPIGSTTVI